MATIEHKIKIPVAFNLSEPMVQINKKTTYSNGGSRTHRQYELSHLLDIEGKKPRVDGVTSIISSQLTAPGLTTGNRTGSGEDCLVTRVNLPLDR